MQIKGDLYLRSPFKLQKSNNNQNNKKCFYNRGELEIFMELLKKISDTLKWKGEKTISYSKTRYI